MPFDVEAAVLSNTRLSNDYNILALEAPEIAAAAQPGQFVMVRPTAGCDPLLRRPFSIFEILRDARGAPAGITLLNKAVGRGTRLLLTLDRQDRIACLGPLGVPFPSLDPPSVAYLVAGGVGLAPFVTLAENLRSRGTRMVLLYGGRTAGDLVRLDRFEALGVELALTTEDGSRGLRGFVTTALERALSEEAGAPGEIVVHACGPTGMMRATARLARSYGRRCLVSLEQVMGCGLGGCYSCVVPVGSGGRRRFVRSCLEGPVFDAEALLWDEMEGH
jgi:dihydroorotate dehydrogenase electron transfer subunit